MGEGAYNEGASADTDMAGQAGEDIQRDQR